MNQPTPIILSSMINDFSSTLLTIHAFQWIICYKLFEIVEKLLFVVLIN
jgi:hypothetical protein